MNSSLICVEHCLALIRYKYFCCVAWFILDFVYWFCFYDLLGCSVWDFLMYVLLLCCCFCCCWCFVCFTCFVVPLGLLSFVVVLLCFVVFMICCDVCFLVIFLLAHLSWKFKWAFLNCIPSFVCLFVCKRLTFLPAARRRSVIWYESCK